ncbi:MAG TPA: cytochrome c biogenesis protein CcdA [Myxococcales bacterium]|nr:cytochrome c biogenesis protein CcdA [Myxococcales bacterium]
MKKWVSRLVLALAIGLLLPFLPGFLTQSVGPGADLSGKLGLGTGVSLATFAVLFAGGVLTSLTPCVYPLIPITVSIFGARQPEHRGRSVALSATYVGGIAAMYSALGLFAALSGKAFGTVLSSPAVVVLLALFLAALAASMFGAFDIAVPAGLQQRLASVTGKGFAHAFGMGLVAGIIAAPCTGPVLAGVLTYVATQRSALLGFWMLFTYALGMGLLFFLLGATSLRLPRSGAWMETVKSVLGVALLAAAVGLLLPFLPRPGPLPLSARSLGLLAGALAFAGVLAGALSLSFHGAAREKAMKLGALVLLVGGVGLRFGWAGAPRADKAFQIPWLKDEKLAVRESLSTGRPLLIDFSAEWCAACKELDVHTWTDPVVAREVSDRFVALKIDATDETEEINQLTNKYGVPGLPTVLMMACKDERPPECAVPGEGPARVTGFLGPPEMLERLRRVQ